MDKGMNLVYAFHMCALIEQFLGLVFYVHEYEWHVYVMKVHSVLMCLYESISHKYTYALIYEHVWP